ncbi:hypothetical protein EPO15_05730 [bacterium]|nr:MAG: hypothetical protein EPO15_05730 [bacterium]
MNRRARRRSAIILATAALTAAVGAFKPLDRRAASAAFDQGVAAARANDAAGASEAFAACLAVRPGREDCQAGLALAKRALLAEESARRAANDAQAQTLLASLAEARAAADPPGAPTAEPDETDKRRAILHWNEGIKAFQKNDVAKARDEWKLCERFDPGMTECGQGLKRLENTYGGGL